MAEQLQQPDNLIDPRHLTRLRHAHRLTFERYMDVASRMHGRLATLTPESGSELERANLVVCSRREVAAYQSYLRSRAALSKYLAVPDAILATAPRAVAQE